MIKTNDENPFDSIKFYVAASDRDMLGRLTSILERKGMISCWEKSGEMSFLLDGRQGGYHVARQISEINDHLRHRRNKQSESQKRLLKLINRALNSYGLREELKGTEFLREIIFHLIVNKGNLTNFSKGVYLDVARHYGTEPKLIDRAIRYTRMQAGITLTNVEFIHKLLNDLQSEASLETKKETIVYSLPGTQITLADLVAENGCGDLASY